MNLRSRDLAPDLLNAESSTNYVTDGSRAPNNTQECGDELQAAKYHVNLGRDEMSFLSNINSITSLSGYLPETESESSASVMDISVAQEPPTINTEEAAQVDINALLDSSLFNSLANGSSPPPATLSEEVMEAIVPVPVQAGHNHSRRLNPVTSHVTERYRSSSCPTRTSPPKASRLPQAAFTGAKRSRDTADFSTASCNELDRALMESAEASNTTAPSSHLTPSPQPPSALARLRPLPSRAGGQRLPTSLTRSPARGTTAAPQSTKQAGKRIRRARE